MVSISGGILDSERHKHLYGIVYLTRLFLLQVRHKYFWILLHEGISRGFCPNDLPDYGSMDACQCTCSTTGRGEKEVLGAFL